MYTSEQKNFVSLISYCAAYLYNIFDGHGRSIDVCHSTAFILSCQSPDSAFGQVPQAEGHGANTYCALAALKLMNRLLLGFIIFINNFIYIILDLL